MPLDTLVINNLSGGLNTRSEDYLIGDSEASSLNNFLFNVDGSLTKRKGTLKYNSSEISANQPVHSLYRFYYLSGSTEVKKMLCICNSQLYEGNDSTGAWTAKGSALSTNNPATFATWGNICYIFNGVDEKTWDGTTLGNVSGSPPNGKYVVFRKDRLYVAGDPAAPNRLYYCDTGDPTTWNTGSNYIDIRSNDGDVITGILPLLDYLVIYKRNSIWLLSGTSSSDFFLTEVHRDVGCKAPKTLVGYEGVHYFFHDTGMFMFDGSNVVNISEKIQPDLDALALSYIANFAAIVYNKTLYLSVVTGTVNDTIYALDIRLGAWSKLTTYNSNDVATRALLGYSSFCVWNGGSDTLRLYAGSSSLGFVHRLDTGTDDNGIDIEVLFKSKNTDVNGVTFGYKQIRRIGLICSNANISPVVSYEMDYSDSLGSLTFTISGVSLWDTAKWDVDSWSGGSIIKQIKDVVWTNSTPRGSNIKLAVSEKSSSSWKLLGIGIQYQVEPDEYKILMG